MSARTPHDVGPQADVAHIIEQELKRAAAGGMACIVPADTLRQAVELLSSLRGEGVAEGEARSERAVAAAQEKLAAVIGIVGRIEQHEQRHSYARRVLARDLRDALGLGRMFITCPCPEHTPPS